VWPQESKEFARLVDIAYGSMIELETQLEIARRLGYASSSNVLAVSGQISELGRILNGLRTTPKYWKPVTDNCEKKMRS
jgi:four helix bundle protein